jgi:hypothetical protein
MSQKILKESRREKPGKKRKEKIKLWRPKWALSYMQKIQHFLSSFKKALKQQKILKEREMRASQKIKINLMCT